MGYVLEWRGDSDTGYGEIDETHRLPVSATIVGPVYMPLFVSDSVRPTYGATSGALDANDAYGDMFVFNGIPQHVRLLSIQVLDQDDVIAAGTLSLYLSRRSFTAAASDAAFTISAADALNAAGPPIAFGAMIDVGSARLLETVDIDRDMNLPEGRLYCQAFTSGTPTPTTGGMPQFTLFFQALA